jgi:hypothetical protein
MFLGVCEYQGRLLLLVDLKKVLSPALGKRPDGAVTIPPPLEGTQHGA